MNKKILIPIIAGAVLLIGALAFLGIRLSQANKANEEMMQLFCEKDKECRRQTSWKPSQTA